MNVTNAISIQERRTVCSRCKFHMITMNTRVYCIPISVLYSIVWIFLERENPNVLMTNEMHNRYNQFVIHIVLSALHVSNESSRSSSGARHNILYYTVWYNRYNRAGESSCCEVVGKT